MINYSLKCANGHVFESWFQSATAFEKLHSSDLVTCSVCGSTQVQKAIMAPRVKKSDKGRESLPIVQSEKDSKIAELKKYVETNSDYVGQNFAQEAREMHEGTAPERSIYGEARPEEAKKLLEDGIPVLPLPFAPKRKTN